MPPSPGLNHAPGPADLPRTRKTFAAYLYWLGERAHARKLKRTVTPKPVSRHDPLARAANELWPWTTVEYPGRYAMLAHILTVKPVTAERYMKRGVAVPRRHYLRMAQYLRARVTSLQALIAKLESAAQK